MKQDELEQIAKIVNDKIAQQDTKRAEENAALLKAIEELKNQVGPGAEATKATSSKPEDTLLEKINKQLVNNQTQINSFPDKKPEEETQDEKTELVKGQIEGWRQIQGLVQEALKKEKISEETQEKIARLKIDATLTDLINQQDAIDAYSMKKLKDAALNSLKEADDLIK
jgi:hypothetical protein